MSRRAMPAVLLSAATLLLAGCSNDDAESAAPEATAVEDVDGEGRALSADELEKALVTVEDLRPGYTKDLPSSDGLLERTSDDPACQAILDDVAAFEANTQDASRAEAWFSNMDALSIIAVELASLEDDRAPQGMALMAEMYETCRTWTQTDTGGGPFAASDVEMHTSPLSFPSPGGDETFASRVRSEKGGYVLSEYDLVVTRVGNSVAFVQYHTGGGDRAEHEEIVRMSVERLEKASGA